jgi:hypothetical protein
MNSKNSEIKSLTSGIHKGLNSLLENKISLDEANDLYRDFKERLDLIKKESVSEKVNLTKGILFSHNINNFCRISFIFKKTSGNLKLEESAGDIAIIDELMDEILNAGIDLSIMELRKNAENSGTIYTVSKKFNNFTLIFGTVTSSKLFDVKKFLMAVDLIKRIFEKQISASNPFFIDYYKTLNINITEYILKKILNGFELIAHIYVFDKIYDIYSHSGKKNLETLSDNILETIKKNYSDASIHILSGGIFLVLLDRDDMAATKMPRIEFSYNNFPIIYNKIKLEILNDTEIYKFWEELYSFRIYTMQRDQ